MINDDTIKLLRECDAGTKMGIDSIEEVLNKIQNKNLFNLLKDFSLKHQNLENRISDKLNEYHDDEKAAHPIAIAMAWLKVNTSYLLNSTDKEITKLMIDGCNMGIQAVSRYMNQYKVADQNSRDLSNELIKIEQDMMDKLRMYL